MIINAKKQKCLTFSQHGAGAPDFSWEVKKGLFEKLQSKDENERIREVTKAFQEEGPHLQSFCGESEW